MRRRVARPLLLAVTALMAGPAAAQQGAFISLFNSGVPSPPPSNARAEQRRDEAGVDKPATRVKNTLPLVKLPPGGAKAETEDERYARKALDLKYSPPAGTALSYVRFPNPRLGQRIGGSVVLGAYAGTRLAGSDSPSPEALTFDPRDGLEAQRNYLSDPRGP